MGSTGLEICSKFSSSVIVSSHSKKAGEDPAALAPLFGPPLESAFEEQKLDGGLGNVGGICWQVRQGGVGVWVDGSQLMVWSWDSP